MRYGGINRWVWMLGLGLLWAVPALAADDVAEPSTINAYREHLDVYLDSRVRIDVVQLTCLAGEPGFLRYYADTADEQGLGGTLTILIPTTNVITKEDRELFARRLQSFESYYRMRKDPVAQPQKTSPRIVMHGKLVQHGCTVALVYDLYPVSMQATARD